MVGFRDIKLYQQQIIHYLYFQCGGFYIIYVIIFATVGGINQEKTHIFAAVSACRPFYPQVF